MWYKESKKEKSETPIEKKLVDLKSPRPEPQVVNEKQLDDYRAEPPTATTEKQLESSRKKASASDGLVEARLNDAKGGTVKHRNEDAHKGNINKLEELRLSGKKSPVQEEEEYDDASSTPKDMRFKNKANADGLKLAQADFSISGDDAFEAETGTAVDTVEPMGGDMDLGEDDDEDAEDENPFAIVEMTPPRIEPNANGGTNIQTGIVSFLVEEFSDERGNFDKDLLEEKVKEYLSRTYSIKTPVLGTVRVLATERRGTVGYIAPVP